MGVGAVEAEAEQMKRMRSALGALAIAAVALGTTGCGTLTIRTWVLVDEENSGGFFVFNGGTPADIGRLQGGILTQVAVPTNDLDGIVNGTIALEDVRIAGEMSVFGFPIGPMCTWANPEGASIGTLTIDLFGDTTGSELFLDAKAMTPLNAALGPIPFAQPVDFDLAGAMDLDTALGAFATGEVDGLFESTFGINSSTEIGGLTADFALNVAIVSGSLPPLFDEDLVAYCGDFFAEQGPSVFYGISAKSSYHRQFGTDQKLDPVVIPLEEIGALPGDVVKIVPRGSYSMLFALKDGPARTVGAVFSETDEYRAGHLVNRIPGAIDGVKTSGGANATDLRTWPTGFWWFGSWITIPGGNDIPQDFRIEGAGIEVVVPEGANYLFLGAMDWLRIWNDNVGLGFGVDVEVIPAGEGV